MRNMSSSGVAWGGHTWPVRIRDEALHFPYNNAILLGHHYGPKAMFLPTEDSLICPYKCLPESSMLYRYMGNSCSRVVPFTIESPHQLRCFLNTVTRPIPFYKNIQSHAVEALG